MTALYDIDIASNGTNGYANETNGTKTPSYSMLDETQKALETLLELAKGQIPPECRQDVIGVSFETSNTETPDFPCPFKETEATGALKAVEAGIGAAIANLRYGNQERRVTVNLERTSSFLFSTYVATVNGHNKADKKSKQYLKGALLDVKVILTTC